MNKFLFLLVFVQLVLCKVWVVLLSGIYPTADLGYVAEADVYQAYYQLVKLGGLDPSTIILHVMDGVADSKGNPYRPNVYAYPNGPEVYQFAKPHFDYVGKNNNPDTLLKVLQGINPGVGSGRVVEATEDDVTFVAMISHGNIGSFHFLMPDGDELHLHADEINDAIKQMKGKVYFYLNSCHSGSIFNGKLDSQGPVIALTGAPPLSKAPVCCHNKTYMCSCFHHNWQLSSRGHLVRHEINSTSIDAQYQEVFAEKQRIETYCEYGNLDSAKSTPISTFQGGAAAGGSLFGGSDPKCNTESNPSSLCIGSRYTKTSARDETNSFIWSSFASVLELGTTTDFLSSINKNGDACSRFEIRDLKCHKKVYEAARNRCNFYANYDDLTPVLLEQACRKHESEHVVDVIEQVCSNVKPVYSLK